MARETKIGLLVGLAFIIVIGILLSDHMSSTSEPQAAALGSAGGNVREGVTTPGGSDGSPISAVGAAPADAPQAPVPTRADLTRPPAPPPPATTGRQRRPVALAPEADVDRAGGGGGGPGRGGRRSPGGGSSRGTTAAATRRPAPGRWPSGRTARPTPVTRTSWSAGIRKSSWLSATAAPRRRAARGRPARPP